MSFSPKIKKDVLIACRRHCVLCGKFCGTKIELHHIEQKKNGGKDTFDNCIPLCLDCHVDVGTYNPNHTKGTKYSKEELIERRDIFYKEIEDGKMKTIAPEVAENFETIFDILKGLFIEEQDGIGAIIGYKCPLFSYETVRNAFENYRPEVIDGLVKWLSENRYLESNIHKDMYGNIVGSIKITMDGLDFYKEHCSD